MFTIFWYSIDLVKELHFPRSLFFSVTCVNLTFLTFTVYINSSLLKLENGRNSLVQMMQNYLVFFSIWRSLYVCLFIYYIYDEPCVTSMTLNIMMVFSNRSIVNFIRKFYYHFFKCWSKDWERYSRRNKKSEI